MRHSIIQRLDNLKINTQFTPLTGKRGDLSSLIYLDLDSSDLKVRQTGGTCLQFRKNGLNTKLKITGVQKSVPFIHSFFVHGPHIIDFTFHK